MNVFFIKWPVLCAIAIQSGQHKQDRYPIAAHLSSSKFLPCKIFFKTCMYRKGLVVKLLSWLLLNCSYFHIFYQLFGQLFAVWGYLLYWTVNPCLKSKFRLGAFYYRVAMYPWHAHRQGNTAVACLPMCVKFLLFFAPHIDWEYGVVPCELFTRCSMTLSWHCISFATSNKVLNLYVCLFVVTAVAINCFLLPKKLPALVVRYKTGKVCFGNHFILVIFNAF